MVFLQKQRSDTPNLINKERFEYQNLIFETNNPEALW